MHNSLCLVMHIDQIKSYSGINLFLPKRTKKNTCVVFCIHYIWSLNSYRNYIPPCLHYLSLLGRPWIGLRTISPTISTWKIMKLKKQDGARHASPNTLYFLGIFRHVVLSFFPGNLPSNTTPKDKRHFWSVRNVAISFV